MSQILQIGNILTSPNTKKIDFINIGETATSSIKIPVGIINGSRSGLTLCITAGVHGSEYPGIEAAIRTYHNVLPEKLNGKLVIVPVVNTPAFARKVAYVCPIDNVNIGRISPEMHAESYTSYLDGSISYKIANFLYGEILTKSDIRIDLHAGDLGEMMLPGGLAFYSIVGEKHVVKISKSLARFYGSKYISVTERARSKWGQNHPQISVEIGGNGLYDEQYIKFHMDGLENVMKHLNMIEGEPNVLCSRQIIFEEKDIFNIRVKHGGIFYPKVNVGDSIKRGQLVAEIGNLKGEVIEKVISHVDGLIRISFPSRVKNSGDVAFRGWRYSSKNK